MGVCGRRGELGAAGWRASDLLTGTLSAAPSNGRAKMGATILGTPLEAPGRGKGELKQSPRYEYTKTARNSAYRARAALARSLRAKIGHGRNTDTRRARGRDE